MPVRRCGRIALVQEPGCSWVYPHSCRTASRQLGELLKSNLRALVLRVFPSVGIDLASRRRKKNLFYDEHGKVIKLSVKEWRSINKGLGMELLSASLFACLDHPLEVKSFCQLSEHGHCEPKSYAAHKLADLEVDYGTFSLVVEVSAKQRVTTENYRTQVNQAINHSKVLIEANPTKPVYALVINHGSIERRMIFRDIYEELEPAARKIGDIRLIPIWAMDFGQAISTLCREDHQLGLQFSSEYLAGALDLIYRRVAIEFVPVEPGWFRATLLAALEGDLDAGKKKEPEDQDQDPNP